jgi:photosystem II stability/assembly factor-like uncharacterized protein
MAVSILTIVLTGIAYLHPFAAVARQPRVAVAPSGYHLAAVDFVSPTTGWVAATLDSGSYAVVRTNDAGESWTEQLTGATDQRTFYLHFFDARHGVLGLTGPRPAMYRTADGGQTWSLRPMSSAAYILSMSFVDPDHGWLLFYTGELFGTDDGGATWANLGVPVAAGDQPFRVQFVDREVGWLDSESAKPVAYTSVDGGVSWRQVPLPAPEGGWPTRGEFFVAAQPTHGEGVVATVVNFAPYVGRSGVGERVVAYPPLTIRSFDGGLPVWYSYSVFTDAIPGRDLRGNRMDQLNRWSTQMQAPHQVHLSSLDGGATWTQVSPPTEAGAVGFSDARTWWWIGSGAWSMSSDGGSTWTPSRNIGVIEPLPGSLQVLDSNTAWYGAMAGGTRAMLERTADAGLHWEMIGLPIIQATSTPQA